MKITALEEYGLRCMIQLARCSQGEESGMSISEIAEKEGLSVQYVSKLMAHLKKEGLVKANRGVHGGYQLIQPSEKIRVSTVVKALNGQMFGGDFCDSHSGNEAVCVHEKNCSVRSVWSVLYAYMNTILDGLTLRDLLENEQGIREKIQKIIMSKKEETIIEASLKIVGS